MFKVSNEAKVGALTALAITILLLGFNFLKGNDLFSSSRIFYAVYDDVDGLTKSNAVVINGYKVGQVTLVQMLPDKKLLVAFELKSDIHISKFDTSKIMANDLFNTKVIRLSNCNLQPEAQEHDTLVAFLQPGMGKMITDALSPLKAKIEKLIVVIDSAASGIKGSMTGANGDDLTKSINDLKQTLSNLKDMSASLSSLVGDEKSKFNQILSNVASITKNFKDNNDLLSKTLKNVKNITDSLAAADFKKTIEETKNVMAGLNATVKKINNGEGSLGLLINDKKLYDNLQKSTDDLDKLLIDMKASPSRYVHFSLFGKKEKKKK